MRRPAQLLVALVAVAAALLTSAAAASAGTYVVTSCGAAGGVNSSWTFERSSTAMRTTDLCAGGNAGDDDLFTTFTPALGIRTELGQPYAPLGTYGYIKIAAPAPLTLVGYRVSFHMHSESDSWRLVAETDKGELAHCQSNEPGSGVTDFCDLGMRGGSVPSSVPDPLPGVQWLRQGMRCVLNPCHMGSTAHAASSALFSAEVTVNDPVAPTASVSGVPAEALAGSALTATVAGGDQTGIQRLELVVDGNVVASSERGCDFKLVLPCAAPGGQVAAQLTTPALSPGVHSVVARTVDAAGNVGTSPASTVTVKAPTPPPGTNPPGTTPPGTNPPPVTPPPVTNEPPTTEPPPASARRAALLRLRSVSRRGSSVRVRGQVAEGCRSRIKIAVRAGGKTRTVKVTAPRSGRWGATIAGVRRGGKATVKVSASRSKVCRPSKRSRKA